MDPQRLNKFQQVLSLQKDKYLEKLERKEYAKEVKRQFDEEQKVQDEKYIRMKNMERENDMKLETASTYQSAKPKISKKRRLKIEKI